MLAAWRNERLTYAGQLLPSRTSRCCRSRCSSRTRPCGWRPRRSPRSSGRRSGAHDPDGSALTARRDRAQARALPHAARGRAGTGGRPRDPMARLVAVAPTRGEGPGVARRGGAGSSAPTWARATARSSIRRVAAQRSGRALPRRRRRPRHAREGRRRASSGCGEEMFLDYLIARRSPTSRSCCSRRRCCRSSLMVEPRGHAIRNPRSGSPRCSRRSRQRNAGRGSAPTTGR